LQQGSECHEQNEYQEGFSKVYYTTTDNDAHRIAALKVAASPAQWRTSSKWLHTKATAHGFSFIEIKREIISSHRVAF
jgi:hypothetical protein